MAKTKMTVGVNLDGDSKGFQKASKDAARSTKELENQLKQTKVGRIWTDFTSGIKMGVNALKTLKGAIMATGIGALLIAVMGIVNWFKKTETGADLLAKGQKILGQAIKEGPMMAFNALKTVILAILIPMRTAISTFKHMRDVLAGKESLKEAIQGIKDDVKSFGDDVVNSAKKIGAAAKNIADASRLADKWDKLEDARRDRKKEDARVEKEIAQLREEASEQVDNAAKKVELLSKAQALLAKQNAVLKKDKQDEIDLINEELRLYPDNQEWIEKLATATAELEEIDTSYADNKRAINKQLIASQKAVTKEELDAMAELKKAYADFAEEQKKIQTDRIEKEQTVVDELRRLNNEITLLLKTGLDRRIAELKIAQEEELNAVIGGEEAKEKVRQKYRILTAQAIAEANKENNANIEENNDREGALFTEAQEERIGNWMKYAQGVSDVLGSLMSIIESNKQKELSAAGSNAKKREEIERKYAKKQQAMAVGQALINTALAITSALLTVPFIPMGLIAAATAGAAGLAQVVAIKSAKFAKGGIVSGPVSAMVGEYANAGSNPEVIAPLDKLKNMIGGGEVVFRIKDNELVGILDRNKRKTTSYK
jgi:hypothetical protein